MVNMKYIILYGGKRTAVDDDDYDKLVALGSWHVSNGYASRYIRVDGRKVRVAVHQIVMGTQCAEGQKTRVVIDHINRDRLDNRKENLRVTDRKTNYWNSDSASKKYIGVTPYPRCAGKPWRARYMGRTIGYFKTKEDGRKAYETAKEMLR